MVRKIFCIFFFVTSLFVFKISSQEVKGLPPQFSIVVGDDVNIRKKPRIESKVISKLLIATKVEILKKAKEKITIGNITGYWVFVDTGIFKDGTRDIIKGWVFDYYLADADKFKRLKDFKKYNIEGWVGDYLVSYKINENGTYVRKDFDYEKNKVKALIPGKLYSYRRIIFAQDDNNSGYEIFYINEDGRLCSTYGDMDRNQICSKEVYKELYERLK